MNTDKLLASLSEHIAFWYTCIKGKKDIIFPINNVIKEKANQIFGDKYKDANIIISENGDIYKIAKEICCQRQMWVYFYYLDDMKKNYRIKRICKDLLPYALNSENGEKIKKICELNIPHKILTIKVKKTDIKNCIKIILPYLRCITYISTKQRKIIAYPDVIQIKENEIIVLLNYYHHHHMNRQIEKIKKALLKYKSNCNIIETK